MRFFYLFMALKQCKNIFYDSRICKIKIKTLCWVNLFCTCRYGQNDLPTFKLSIRMVERQLI